MTTPREYTNEELLLRARLALAWYEEQADAIARYMNADPPNLEAAMACMTALALDGGNRARNACRTRVEWEIVQ